MVKLFLSKRKIILNLLFQIWLLIFSFSLKANYISGGKINYQSMGNNQYLVKVSIYRDCSGGNSPTNLLLTVSSGTCNFTSTYSMDSLEISEVFSICPSQISVCNGGFYHGFQQCEYRVTVTLPLQCNDWVFSVRECCFINGITTIQNPDSNYLYLDAGLNNLGMNNQSAQLNNLFNATCLGVPNNFNLGATDADNDSLVISLIDIQTDINSFVSYKSGYTGSNPITSSPPVTLSSNTGDVTIQPLDTNEYGIIAFRTYEYRNGNLVGYTTTSLPLLVLVCGNHLSGINCGMATIDTIEATVPFCFDLITYDSNPYDTLTLTWNQSIPGATFYTSSGLNPIGHFCWTPSLNDIRPQPYYLYFTMVDHTCGIDGTYMCAIGIIVSPYTVINTITKEIGINIYPNPTTGEFNLHSEISKVVDRFLIIDVLGNILTEFSGQSKLNIQDLPNGYYFVKAEFKDGNILFGKIMKE